MWAFKVGASIGGPPLGAAFATASALFTGAQIALLNAQTFGSSSAPGVGGGSLPSSPSPSTGIDGGNQSQVAGQTTLQVIFNGPTYGLADFNDKVGEAVRANSDRDVIMITSGSRQATEIRGA